MTPLLTLFDLDHTLLRIDSDFAWGQFTTQIGWTDADEFSRRNEEFFAHYKAGTLNVADYVRFATEAVRLHGPDEAAAAHAQFMREVVLPEVDPEALALLRRHQEAGDTVIIVTATNEFVTRPIAVALGVDELIAVELEHDTAPGGTGWITSDLTGTTANPLSGSPTNTPSACTSSTATAPRKPWSAGCPPPSG